MKRGNQDHESESMAIGYVNAHTPPRQGTNHFCFDLQTSPHEVKRAICFDNSESSTIHDYLESGSPVKLHCISYRPLNTSNKYLAEIKLNPRSIITTANNSQINFNPKKTVNTSSTITVKVADIQKYSDGDLVTVQGIVTLSNSQPTQQKCRNGQSRLMLENNILSDETGHCSLTL